MGSEGTSSRVIEQSRRDEYPVDCVKISDWPSKVKDRDWRRRRVGLRDSKKEYEGATEIETCPDNE